MKAVASRPEPAIPTGSERTFAIGGVGVRFTCELDGAALSMPESFAPFESPGSPVQVEAVARLAPRLEPAGGELVFDSSLHWRALAEGGGLVFELFHPPSAERYCRLTVDAGFSEAEILFSEQWWRRRVPDAAPWTLPHPLDQLLLAPALGLREVCLLHACGAIVDGEALVFAGHSGDGKTTLARLLAAEGLPLLSDERVALEREGGAFLAGGTPWPGEGDVVSNTRRPLGGLFVLRKSGRHEVRRAGERGVSAELVARAIVPYYLPDVAARILGLLDEAASQVPVRELGFARAPGLAAVLGRLPA